jgi:sulfite reductase (NADPH) hemoprotein beta-component
MKAWYGFIKAHIYGVIEAVLNKYLELRAPTNNGRAEYFVETLRRVGQEPFKLEANAARHTDPVDPVIA